MNANEVFQKHGLHFEDAEHAAVELADLDVEELWDIAEDFQDGELGIMGDEDVQAAILRAALIQAFTDNRDHITQQDLDLAQETALELEGDVTEETETVEASSDKEDVATDETPEQEAAEESSEAPAKRTRKRTSESREIMKNLIEANPNDSRKTILEKTYDAGAEISDATAVTYFYDIRKELGLSTNGKRGRKPNADKIHVQKFIYANKDSMDKDELVQQMMVKFGYKESTARQYYYLATRERK